QGEILLEQGDARTLQSKFSSPVSANLEQMAFDLPKLAGNIHVKDAALPGGQMQGDIALKLQADVEQEKVNSDFNLNAHKSKLKGNVAVDGFSKPAINFTLAADQLDLNKWLGQKAGKQKADDKNARASGA